MDSLYVHSRRRLAERTLLAVLCLSIAGTHILAAERTTKVLNNQKPPWLGSKKNIDSLTGQDNTPRPLQTMVVYSLLIVVLGVVAVLLIKKLLPKMQRSAGKNLRILETAYLSPRSSIHLLGIGSKKYLLSRSNEGVSLLADVSQALLDEETSRSLAE